MSNVLCDPRAETVLARLRDLETQQSPEMRRYYDAKRRAGSGPTNPGSADDMSFVRDKLVALDPEKCDLCYLLCRSLRATRGVEFGTSFGVSTIYLAAAVRDNMRDFGGEGVVIGTEIEPSKAAIAQQNLSDADLDEVGEAGIGRLHLPGARSAQRLSFRAAVAPGRHRAVRQAELVPARHPADTLERSAAAWIDSKPAWVASLRALR